MKGWVSEDVLEYLKKMKKQEQTGQKKTPNWVSSSN